MRSHRCRLTSASTVALSQPDRRMSQNEKVILGDLFGKKARFLEDRMDDLDSCGLYPTSCVFCQFFTRGVYP